MYISSSQICAYIDHYYANCFSALSSAFCKNARHGGIQTISWTCQYSSTICNIGYKSSGFQKMAYHLMECHLTSFVRSFSHSCTFLTRRTRATKTVRSKKWAANTVKISRGRPNFLRRESSSWIKKYRLKLQATTLRFGRPFSLWTKISTAL